MLDSRTLRSMADRCRAMASTRHSDEASRTLLRMAEVYELQARERERQLTPTD